MEKTFPYFFTTGLAIALISFFWLIVVAYRQSTRTGVIVTLFPPLAIIYATRHLKLARWPLGLFLGGLLLAVFPAIHTKLTPVDLRPYEKIVNGEVHITVTGWDSDDYSFLSRKPEVVVLQMANADVTDAAVAQLRGFQKLRMLDLNQTQITDVSLPVIASLPALADLKMRKTKVTDSGFKQQLTAHESLMLLDVRETEIAKETVQGWKEAKPKRRAMQ